MPAPKASTPCSGINLGGLPIWIILWLVYNQHRLERVEALETEQLAADDARTTAFFDEAGQAVADGPEAVGPSLQVRDEHRQLAGSPAYLLTMGFVMLNKALGAYRIAAEVEAGGYFQDIGKMVPCPAARLPAAALARWRSSR